MEEKVPSFNDVVLKNLEASNTPESSDDDKKEIVIEKTFYNFLKYKIFGSQIFIDEQTNQKLTPSTSSSANTAQESSSLTDKPTNPVFPNKAES